MAHEVESMFSVKVTPWHGLGTIVQDAPTTQEAIRLAGLDWQVKLEQLQTAGGLITDHNALVRSTDNSILGVVGPRYTPLQNSEAFKFFDAYVENKECCFETAGSLREGQRIWILARLNRAPIEVVKGDFVEKFLLLSNSHDGTMAVRVGFTPIRVVCANTLAMAHNNAESKLIRVCHGKHVAYNLEKIREIVNLANAQFEATAEQYKFLASREINQDDLAKFVKIVFDIKPESMMEQRAKLAADKLTARIKELFTLGIGNEQQGVGGTYWAAYNAVTQYLSYDAARNQDNRLNSLWFGQNKNLNEHALVTALKLAA